MKVRMASGFGDEGESDNESGEQVAADVGKPFLAQIFHGTEDRELEDRREGDQEEVGRRPRGGRRIQGSLVGFKGGGSSLIRMEGRRRLWASAMEL